MTELVVDAATSTTRFVDFTIRAWREGDYLQVMAHSTPVGGMRHPVSVKARSGTLSQLRLSLEASIGEAADLGRELSRLLLPREVWEILSESFAVVAPDPRLGIRLRLCLDEDLIDLPWEYLYRPDIDARAALSGFLVMDGRISLVREPPSVVVPSTPSDRTQRGLFVGTFFEDGTDGWDVVAEHSSLEHAMAPIARLISMEFTRADAQNEMERAIDAGCDLFHYAGHTETNEGHGVVVQLARTNFDGDQLGVHASMEACTGERASWTRNVELAPRLARGGTRLAVFNACNSGFWPFVRPFMHAGIPALIGVQGIVSNLAALNFSEKLYQSLACGLSLDEALTFARLYVTEPGRSYYPCDWGRFMAYMPTSSTVLFPRSDRKRILRHKTKVREQRERTVENARSRVTELDGVGVSRMLSDIASRSVLILGRFTKQRKAVLDAIKRALSSPPRTYVPILFDFDKPNDRDLIESIVRFASVSRFVIADLSDPKSVPAELQAIVPQFPSLPVVLIIEGGQREYPVIDHLRRRASVMKTIVHYEDSMHLNSILDAEVLAPAEDLYRALQPKAISS